MGDQWNTSLQSKEQIEAGLVSKQEAAARRERALAYAFSHQVGCITACSYQVAMLGFYRQSSLGMLITF